VFVWSFGGAVGAVYEGVNATPPAASRASGYDEPEQDPDE